MGKEKQGIEKMTDKEIQASDEEMEQFNVLQNEKCVSVKTEKLNDLKNRISFALKDATLQQGFEIICKRISELEKENEDLKAEIGLNEATIQGQLEERVKVIKENEDLKKQIEQMKCCENCIHDYDNYEGFRRCNVLNQLQMIVFKKCDKWELKKIKINGRG